MKGTFSLKSFFGLVAVVAMMLTLDACKKENDRDLFLGGYSVSETCTNSVGSYEIQMTDLETSEKALIIHNLWDWGDYVTAEVEKTDIDIPQQNINGMIYQGSGERNGTKVTIDLIVSDGVNPAEYCTLECVKK